MKDALGHGSDARGGTTSAHQQLVDKIGRRLSVNPNVVNIIKNNPEGASVTLGGKQPTSGFMVSTRGHSETIPAGSLTEQTVHDYANRHAAALSKSGAHIGTWLDKSSNQVYLDVSQNIKNRNAAVRSGIARNQKAIWDVRKGREISTGGTGE